MDVNAIEMHLTIGIGLGIVLWLVLIGVIVWLNNENFNGDSQTREAIHKLSMEISKVEFEVRELKINQQREGNFRE